MIEASLKVSKSLLDYPIEIAKIIILLSFIVKLAGKDYGNDLSEFIISLIKCASYGALAWFIYVNTRKLEQIDVLTYFTFLLACIEVGHNFANSVGAWLAVAIRVLLKRIIGGKWSI